MAKFKRWFPKKESEIKNTPYDSLLEKRLHETTLADTEFHPKEKISYSVPHTYEVDFRYEKDGKVFLIEAKGRFTDPDTARKYLFIRDYLPENHELVFIFESEFTRFPYAKKRKNGTYRTQVEWADDHKFRHWTKDTFTLEQL